MKKVIFFAALAVAFTFVSCDNKKTDDTQATVDSVAAEVVDEGVEMTNKLNEAVEANDANLLETTLNDVKTRLGELDTEKAEGALAAVQAFLKENADKVKAVVGNNNVLNTLVNDVNNMTNESLNSLKAAGAATENAAADAVNAAEKGAKEAVDNVKKDVDQKVQEVKEAPKKAVDNVREQGKNAVDKTAEKVKGLL